jgi:hypothetical protein
MLIDIAIIVTSDLSLSSARVSALNPVHDPNVSPLVCHPTCYHEVLSNLSVLSIGPSVHGLIILGMRSEEVNSWKF